MHILINPFSFMAVYTRCLYLSLSLSHSLIIYSHCGFLFLSVSLFVVLIAYHSDADADA